MRRSALMLLAALTALTAGGCYLGHFWVALTKPREYKTIEAEHRFDAKKLVIVPYAGTDILFSYPTATIEISREIVYAATRHLRDCVQVIEHPVRVAQWQESNLEWPNLSLAEIADVFGADTVLYVELHQYTVLEERSANLFRGRVKARLHVWERDAPTSPVYEGSVESAFPEKQPVSVLGTSERTMRHYTNVTFAEDVINKFRTRRVEVRLGQAS